ncbi:hypothetical protein [Microbulbifer sp. GL-2]|uniref:hypothetical protein n=1 Tax=Microbulbifer sp. GL-2 TaxID=2591606 RepID=UPI001165C1D1|nr:hypothetical protein [Microbulbifer sp. GL-2]BBM03570.1 hypothetical protein GL2_36440 [Microbulbifer sp. GL-2]
MAGKIWNLPNTMIGLGVSTLALGADLIQSAVLTAFTFENHFQNIGFSFGNNALQIRTGLTLPGNTGGGLTIGNVILYNNSRPGQNIRSPYAGNRQVNLGRHEGFHTRQGERLGIFYLPAMIWHGVAAPNNPLEIQADDNSLVR